MPETAGPIIYQTNNLPASKGLNPLGWLIRIVIGLIFIGLIIFIVFQIYNAIQLLSKTGSPPSTSSNNSSAASPTVGLSIANPDIAVGSQIQVPISVNTSGKKVIGVDVVIKYDPQFFQATNSGTLKVFQPSQIFDEYPIAVADTNRGEIRVSGIASNSQSGFNGIGVLGTLTLKTLKTGQSTLTFDYLPNGTTDSNMVEYMTGVDILSAVENLDLTIR